MKISNDIKDELEALNEAFNLLVQILVEKRILDENMSLDDELEYLKTNGKLAK